MRETNFKLAVVPHAPLLVPGVGGRNDPCAASRKSAVEILTSLGGATTIFLSPHSQGTCVYAKAQGDLAGFGIAGVGVSGEVAPQSDELAGAWNQPLLGAPLDHGIAIPLSLVLRGSASIFCGISESAGLPSKLRQGIDLARAIAAFDWPTDVTFVASAQTAASLTPRAPLTERPEGAEFDRRLLHAIENEPSLLVDPTYISEELWLRSGCCSAGPFAALGEMALVLGVKAMKILTYEAPVGVGMLVAGGAP